MYKLDQGNTWQQLCMALEWGLGVTRPLGQSLLEKSIHHPAVYVIYHSCALESTAAFICT